MIVRLREMAVLDHRGSRVLSRPSLLAEVDEEREQTHEEQAGHDDHDHRDVVRGGH
jgi:hypothetical protein